MGFIGILHGYETKRRKANEPTRYILPSLCVPTAISIVPQEVKPEKVTLEYIVRKISATSAMFATRPLATQKRRSSTAYEPMQKL
jgi:hypothetical protein